MRGLSFSSSYKNRTPSTHRETTMTAFDGEAISRADREFLAKLGDHPLMRNPLYSVLEPPLPDYSGCIGAADRTAAQAAAFPQALKWMLVNYAFYEDAFMNKGGIISLVDGKITTIAARRSA